MQRSARGAGSAVAREQLRAIDAKFQPGATPLEREPFEKTIKPQYKDQLEQMMKLMTQYAEQKGDDSTKNAVALWQAQVQQGTFNDQVKFDFARRFYYWLLGRGTDEDHKKTFWGRGNAAVYNPEVRQYIEAFSTKRLQYGQQLALLASVLPTTLNGYYLYFKYIVGGNLERKVDPTSGTAFFDISDEDYLADFEMFQQEFDNKTDPKMGGRDQWLAKPFTDKNRPPNDKNASQVGEMPYPRMNTQAQVERYAVTGLSRKPGQGDPVANSMVNSSISLEQRYSRNNTSAEQSGEDAVEQSDVVGLHAVLGGEQTPIPRSHSRHDTPSRMDTPVTPFTKKEASSSMSSGSSVSLLPEKSSEMRQPQFNKDGDEIARAAPLKELSKAGIAQFEWGAAQAPTHAAENASTESERQDALRQAEVLNQSAAKERVEEVPKDKEEADAPHAKEVSKLPEVEVKPLSALTAALDESVLEELADIALPNSPAESFARDLEFAVVQHAQDKGLTKEDQALLQKTIVALDKAQTLQEGEAVLQEIYSNAVDILNSETDAEKRVGTKIAKALGNTPGKRTTEPKTRGAKSKTSFKDMASANKIHGMLNEFQKNGQDLDADQREVVEKYIRMGLIPRSKLVAFDKVISIRSRLKK